MPNYSDQTIAEALAGIQHRRYVLPAIQREFVWGTDRICALFDSLMRDYPISSLLYWSVSKDNANDYRWYDFVLNYHELDSPGCPPHENLPAEDRVAILDGQQRLTALNIGLRGSHAARAKYRWSGRPQSYPKKHLYLDICAEPQLAEDRYEDQVYRFEFLEPDRAQQENVAEGASAHWFRVSAVLDFPADAESGMAINAYLRERGLADHPHAFTTLFRLWQAVFQHRHISYFTETAQSLDRVLDIFIRVNSQGQPLSKSDLLMSIATAQWQERDAREEIPGTLRQINAVAPGFGFSRDHMLKAGLVLAGISDVGFRADTFNRDNMRKLEQAWDTISQRLYLAVELLSSFGLSRDNIDAGAVLIPVAYYLHRRGLDDRYLASTSTASDRQRVRDWTIRALVMPGVFGSGLDTLLGRLRRVIDESGADGFPSDAIETRWPPPASRCASTRRPSTSWPTPPTARRTPSRCCRSFTPASTPPRRTTSTTSSRATSSAAITSGRLATTRIRSSGSSSTHATVSPTYNSCRVARTSARASGSPSPGLARSTPIRRHSRDTSTRTTWATYPRPSAASSTSTKVDESGCARD